MTTTISEHVSRFVAMKRKLGYRFERNERVLSSFASFARLAMKHSSDPKPPSSGHRRRHHSLKESEGCVRYMTLAAGCTPKMSATKCRLAMLWAV